MKPIILLDAFISDIHDEDILNNFINSMAGQDDIFLISNTKVKKEIQNKVQYFLYDERNNLFSDGYTNYDIVFYWTQYSKFKINDVFPHTQKHGLSVLINLFNSVKFVKSLGYTHFYKMEYDALLGSETIQKIKKTNNDCVENKKKGVFYVDSLIHPTELCAHYFFCECDYFLNNFHNVFSEEDYKSFLLQEKGNLNFLIMEKFMCHNLRKINSEDVVVLGNFWEEFVDTNWNTKHTRVYYEEKYKGSHTKFYNIKNSPTDKILIFSKNTTSNPTVRKIVVKQNDGKEYTIIHALNYFGDCSNNIIDNNVEKIIVYDEDDNFLYEEKFEPTNNFVEYF